MDILVVQALCLCGLFLSTLILTVLPLRIFGKPRFSNSRFGKSFLGKYDNFISFANCLSGGVFLATFFVGLLPEVRIETVKLVKTSNLSTSIPVTEVIVLIGFFLALFVEQFAMSAKDYHKSKCKKRAANSKETDVTPGNGTAAHQDLNDGRLYSSGVGTGTVSTSLAASAGIADKEDEEEATMDIDADGHLNENASQLMSIKISPSETNHTEVNNVNDYGDHGHEHDHGHGHSHNVESLVSETAGVKLGILLLSLGVHCLFEGIALGLQNEYHTLINLFIGVWIHECLIALALGLSMVTARPKPCRMWQIALFFSSLIPLGQVIGIVIGSSESWTSRVISTILQGIAAGTFVQVTFLDVIPEGLGPVGSPNRLIKVGLLFLGFIVIAAVSILVEVFGIHAHH